MLVYGDAAWKVAPGQMLESIRRAVGELHQVPAGIERHAALVTCFIEAGCLLQGVADAEFAARGGVDAASPTQAAAIALLASLAQAVRASWESGFVRVVPPPPELFQSAEAAVPSVEVSIKQPEGYAFYAVYPEGYAQAASALAGPDPVRVVGIRSIGTGLAAMVAAATGAPTPVTVRPMGPPFRRELSLAPELRREIVQADPRTRFAIVDEGPGLSGSSFGAVADLLEASGVLPRRIHFFPSHAGDLGPEAHPRHRDRWRTAARHLAPFDDLVLRSEHPSHRLETWIADLVGTLTEPLADLSAGTWRRLRYADERHWPAAHIQQERRKYLARTASGAWLVKFAGLGREGAAKAERGRALAKAGFCPEVAGFRHGFGVERWVEPARALDPDRMDRKTLVDTLGCYLGFRARSFPAPSNGSASLENLWAMARHNAEEAIGPAAATLDRLRPACARLETRVRRVETDNRLHAWEWLVTPSGRILKTDALDHHSGHDLVGCQDIAWDVAGAACELALSPEEQERLCRGIEATSGRSVDRALLDFYRPCYLAFQLGFHTLAATSLAGSPEEPRLRRAAAAYAERLETWCGRPARPV